ncbi:MAG: hypothetical protein ABI369_03485 [Acetobacteraceae bacterium]
MFGKETSRRPMVGTRSLFAAAAAPIATTDEEAQGSRIEVLELKRVGGGTVMLRFTVINESDAAFPSFYTFKGTEAASVDGVYLVDFAGKKKYEVVRDSDKNCVCSRDLPSEFKPKSSTALWAKFPAPAGNVEQVGVVIPHFIPMDDVPLGR